MSELQAIETPDTSAEGPQGPEVSAPEERIEEAKAKGWVDQDAWVEQGNDPELHRDHETFLKYGEQRNNILREENKRLARQFTDIKKQIDVMKKFQDTNIQMAIDQALAEKEIAKQNMDIDGFEKATEKLQKLQEKPADTANYTYVAQDWMSENPWFNKDLKLTDMARGYDLLLMQQNLSPEQHFAALDEKMKPFLAKEPPIQTVSAGRRPGNVTKTGWDSLDAEEKANFENVKNLPAYSGTDGKEKYAKTMQSYKARHGE